MNSPSLHAVPRDSITSAIETLTDSTNLLKAFTHRNKNQHASSHWFSRLSILRRNLSRMQNELAALEVETRTRGLLQQRKKAQRDDGKETATLKRAAKAEARVVKRATWMRNAIVPRSYTAFTQLTADNQHSALGLFLLSLLAKVNTLLASLLPSAEQDAQLSPSAAAWQQPATSGPSGVPPYSSLGRHQEYLGDKDRGEFVARGHLPSKISAVKHEPSSVGLKPEGPVDGSKTSPTSPEKGKALNHEVESDKGKKSGSREVGKKGKDKKKCKREGDEFSNLFGSL